MENLGASQSLFEGLFLEPGKPALPVAMRLSRRNSHPFVLLPIMPSQAAQTLDLYPAQTGRAKVAKALLRASLLAGLKFGTEDHTVSVSIDGALMRFLCKLTRARGNCRPTFGALLGNPRAAGQRFVLLVFDLDGNPSFVVKAGALPAARKLIKAEHTILSSLPGDALAAPQLMDVLESEHVSAIAMPHFRGNSPGVNDFQSLSGILKSWLRPQTRLIREISTWVDLRTACGTDPIFRQLAVELESESICTSIWHGDLAPWNIRVGRDGEWVVLDWERGNLEGIPGWDWFNFVIQPSVKTPQRS
jgi:hypothetical protein